MTFVILLSNSKTRMRYNTKYPPKYLNMCNNYDIIPSYKSNSDNEGSVQLLI